MIRIIKAPRSGKYAHCFLIGCMVSDSHPRVIFYEQRSSMFKLV